VQVFGDHVDDVVVIEPGRYRELVQRFAVPGADADQQAVDRVAGHGIAVDVRAEPAVAVIEAVRVRRDGGPGAGGDRVEGDGGPGLFQVNRRIVRLDRIHDDFAAAVTQVGLVDRVQENPSRLQVRRIAEHQTTPIAWLGRLVVRVRVAAKGIVVIGAEQDGVVRSAEDLERAAAAVDVRDRRADVDIRLAQLEQGPFVDHQRGALGYGDPVAVFQRQILVVRADQIGRIVRRRVRIAVAARVSHDADQVRCTEQAGRARDVHPAGPRHLDGRSRRREARNGRRGRRERIDGIANRHRDTPLVGHDVQARPAAPVGRVRDGDHRDRGARQQRRELDVHRGRVDRAARHPNVTRVDVPQRLQCGADLGGRRGVRQRTGRRRRRRAKTERKGSR